MTEELDKKLVALCVSHSDLFAKSINDFKDDYLERPYKQIYQFIHQYYLKFQKLPSLEKLEQKLNEKKDKLLRLEKDPEGTILSLITATSLVNHSDYDYYVEEIRNRASRNMLQHALPEIVKVVKEEQDYEKVANLLQNAASSIKKNQLKQSILSGDNNYTDEVLKKYLDLEANPDIKWGVKTGFPPIDDATYGFNAALIIIAARQGKGKSQFLMTVAVNQFKMGLNVVFFSLEMPLEQIYTRMVSCYSGLEINKITSGNLNSEEKSIFFNTLREIKEKENKFTIIDIPSASVAIIESEMTNLKNSGKKIDSFFVDYLGIVKSADSKVADHLALGQISIGLRDIGRKLNIPCYTASQLNRDGSKGKTKTKGTERLGRSDQLGDTADYIIQMGEDDEDYLKMSDKAEFFCIKNRKGTSGYRFILRKNFACSRFEEWEENWK